MFSYYWSVDRSGVCNPHMARDQFGKHELVHRRRGRMDPAQVVRGFELFKAKLPCDQDFGIGDFLAEFVEILKLNKRVLGKVALEARPKPLRRIPEFEVMVNGEEDFHGR